MTEEIALELPPVDTTQEIALEQNQGLTRLYVFQIIREKKYDLFDLLARSIEGKIPTRASLANNPTDPIILAPRLVAHFLKQYQNRRLQALEITIVQEGDDMIGDLTIQNYGRIRGVPIVEFEELFFYQHELDALKNPSEENADPEVSDRSEKAYLRFIGVLLYPSIKSSGDKKIVISNLVQEMVGIASSLGLGIDPDDLAESTLHAKISGALLQYKPELEKLGYILPHRGKKQNPESVQ